MPLPGQHMRSILSLNFSAGAAPQGLAHLVDGMTLEICPVHRERMNA